MICPVTSYIFPDEPCFQLREEDIVNPKGKRRRFRIFVVVRSDRLAEHWEDLGPSNQFRKQDPVRILGGVRDPDTQRIFIEHTVGELLDIVHSVRHAQWGEYIKQRELA